MSQNPLIAASVPTLAVSLACRDRAQARDLAVFARARDDELRRVLRSYHLRWDETVYGEDKEACRMEFGVLEESDWLHDHDRDVDKGFEHDWATPEAFECFRNYHRIRHALDDLQDKLKLAPEQVFDGTGSRRDYDVLDYTPAWGVERERAVQTYRQLIKEAHKVYSQKHQEQLQIIRDGSFAQAVARCLAKVQRKEVQVVIVEEPEPKMITGWERHSPAWYNNDNDRLFWVMSSSNYWGSIGGNSDGQEERPPVNRLFTEIPVTCYQAGAPLANLKIECHPFAGEYFDLFPLSPKLPSLRKWSAELGVACQYLKSFEFDDPSSFDLRHLPMEPASIHMDAFLSAMLSGGRLESVVMRMHPYDLGPVLAPAAGSWTHLRSLFLVDRHGIDQQDLEAMFRTWLEEPRHLGLIRARLRAAPSGGSSSSANALDIMREKLATCRTFDFDGVEMDEIYAEAGQCKAQKQGDDWGVTEEEGFPRLMAINLTSLVQHYVSGDARVPENPLRGDREELCERISRAKKNLLLP